MCQIRLIFRDTLHMKKSRAEIRITLKLLLSKSIPSDRMKSQSGDKFFTVPQTSQLQATTFAVAREVAYQIETRQSRRFVTEAA